MDLLDLYWNVTQDREIGEVRRQFEQLDRDRLGGDVKLKDLVEENRELKLRLAVLLRLLIGKGIFTAQEFATLLTEARPAAPGADK
jgi:hypothetical protein